MVKLHNPALHEEPRSQVTTVIPLRHESSILDWLQSTGRLVPRTSGEYGAYYDDEEEEGLPEELTAIVGETESFDVAPEEELELEE